MVKHDEQKGISLRTVHIWLIIGAIIISGIMFYSTYDLSSSFYRITATSEEQIALRKAARELMEASDYLTERVQRFSVQGDIRFMNEYFKEVYETKHREEAILTMSGVSGAEVALAELQAAMDESVLLMNRECYAMRLVVEAKGYSDYPQEIQSVKLSDEDQALAPQEKMRRATIMVHDNGYYERKERIREKMGASLDELEQMYYSTDASALESLRDEMLVLRLSITLLIAGVFFLVWLTSRLGIHPVLNAVEHIKADSTIPEVGANEFRYLANAYNKMYYAYKSSLEHLNFKASHDELTGAYNRSGYELILSSIDFSSTYMLLFDVDNFKTINDTYGHEAGDKALIKLVRILKSNFRDDDYICRIGGDEFVVFMGHSANTQSRQILSKIEKINKELTESNEELPPISISVGIAHGKNADSAEDWFAKADEAMYQAKQNGKHTYAFYSN
ncbi:MAG: GGDEF domain-containing protein [Clostridia bacterium]|nr:GGDEF domain-containing protein [Clostridia bacterium]